MNKFLNRKVISSTKKIKSRDQEPENKMCPSGILSRFENCWNSLSIARQKLERSVMYAYEDQWGDYVTDPDTGSQVTEAELIKRQGKVPLKNNMIAPILKNIDGQFRSAITQTICSVRDSKEAKIGEMMSIAMEYVRDNNETDELDSNSLRMLELGGWCAQRVEYGFNSSKRQTDVWVYDVNPSRMFFNTNVEDPRGWDLNCIGEIFDMPRDRVIALFAKTPKDKERIARIYSGVSDENYTNSFGMQGEETKGLSFGSASRPDMCRVILGWTLESREAISWNDELNGTFGWAELSMENRIIQENTNRINEALQHGIAKEDTLLINYEYGVEQYWYYRYITPMGHILQEGKSPYWHESHNYAFHVYPMIQGKIFNFVEDFIDQQRAINRTLTLIDFIRGASSKGVIIVDESAFEGTMTREEIIDEYVRYNGVIFAKPKNGIGVDRAIKQINGNASVSGDYELLNLQLKLINDISGVNSAMQGKAPASGTAASLYAQQVENSSLNLKGLLESFKGFRRRRDYKIMQTIQQYYNSARHLDLSGSNYSEEAKYYDPTKVQGALIDLKITDGGNSPVYQMAQNEFLMQLFQQQAIDVKMLLENSSLPFASNILESIKRKEQEIDTSMLQQGAPNPEALAMMNNNANASPVDGMIQTT